MRYLSLVAILLVCLLASAAAWADSGGAVLVGKDSQGRNVYLRVIPLKHMDASLAAMLFGGAEVDASGLGGGSQFGGSSWDRGYLRRSDSSRGQSYQGDWGYGGYSQGRGSYGTSRGYASPYPVR